MKWIFVILVLCSVVAKGQDLEPRSITTLPLKTNFIGTGYNYSFGNVFLDPAIPIKDLNSSIHSSFLAYVRSFGLLGNSSKVSVVVPFANAHFEAFAFMQDTTRDIAGLGDPILTFSTNFYGSPALNLKDYSSYKQGTVIGFNLKMRIPMGQYDHQRTINIGSNRFMFRPEIGISTRSGKWIFESYIAFWLFTPNNSFWRINETLTMTQKPILIFKQHVIYALENKSWLAFNIGYGIGGITTVDEIELNNRISTLRIGGTFAKPLGIKHSLKLSYNNAIAFENGPDYQSVSLTYQYRWFNK